MKINNETKVGLLAIIAIATLVFGYNILRGKSVLNNKQTKIYALYDDVKNLPIAAKVLYKGLEIGSIINKEPTDEYATKIKITIALSRNLKIPKNSIAIISSDIIGLSGAVIDIKPSPDNNLYITSGDTLLTSIPNSLLNDLTKQLNPVLYEATNAVHSLDSVLKLVSSTITPSAKEDFRYILSNSNKITSNLITTTATIQKILNEQQAALGQTLTNASEFTKTLASNKDKINKIVSNFTTTSNNIAALDVKATLDKLNTTITDLQFAIKKLNNENGTLGKLVNDPALYNQLQSLTFSMNTLVDDIKVSPKRYISLLGRKDKKIAPLTRPLALDTLNKEPKY